MVTDLANMAAASYMGPGDCSHTVKTWSYSDDSITQLVVIFGMVGGGYGVVWGSLLPGSTMVNGASFRCDTVEQAIAYCDHDSQCDLCHDAAQEFANEEIPIDRAAVFELRKSAGWYE